MVKFSREFDAQLIPEWKDAFADYRRLKKLVKKIKLSSRTPPKAKPSDLRTCWLVLLAVGSFLIRCLRHVAESVGHSRRPSPADEDNSMQMGCDGVEVEVESGISGDDEEEARTNVNGIGAVDLLHPRAHHVMFMEALEEEHHKVNHFYMKREAEFMERARSLLHQLHTLLLLKHPSPPIPDETDDFRPRDRPTKRSHATTSSGGVVVDATPWKEGGMICIRNNGSLSRKDVQRAEKTIRGALVDLYRALVLLNKFRTLNLSAFVKILKKFDKVSSQKASQHYLETVKGSHFCVSDQVIKLMLDVESLFTEHFANNDRKKAMMYLRPSQRRESHAVTFLVGLLTGCFVTLFFLYATLAHALGLFSSDSSLNYMETFYPVFSIFALFGLHLFMHGCNLFLWKKTGINNNFIFEFSPNTALNHRDAFLLSTTFMTAVVGTMVVDLLLRRNDAPDSQLNAIPGILLVAFIGLLICPFDVFYRPTRYCFIRIMCSIVCAPFTKVAMADFFLGDQLTSQVQLMRYIETSACYIIAANFRTHHYNACKSGRFYWELIYVISFLPYYWRFWQCGRRWYDDSDKVHIANMGKYLSAMVAAGVRITYAREQTLTCFVLVLVTSLVATLYQLYWDFVQDWGFFNPKSSNRWLRNDLVLKNKGIYYVSIGFNSVLRVVWVITVLQFRVGTVGSHLLEFSVASLEVIRRGHWNFYRVENEHLNNVGKFRVVKSVPLPFRDHPDD
ncbi:hypothetical protein MLD38_011953 [Melastoma candidum]|uniref:Uncharacterized protein n=1 Tax=Melastoma candidum TaxID=119954 RepID=A0ACB9R454_9MYRT|nr:hypothetical protein MLD38_011953 [Melastoma candidum]